MRRVGVRAVPLVVVLQVCAGHLRIQDAEVPRLLATLAKFATFLQIDLQARSRLYQKEILQEIMRLTAFFKLYKICILLHRCNLKIFAKNRFEKSSLLKC